MDEMQWLEMISAVGNARSKYIEAIQEAKTGDYVACNELIRQGNEAYAQGHRIHAGLNAKAAGGEKHMAGLLMMHAEDQLMSAEAFKILCSEFLDVFKRLDDLKAKLS